MIVVDISTSSVESSSKIVVLIITSSFLLLTNPTGVLGWCVSINIRWASENGFLRVLLKGLYNAITKSPSEADLTLRFISEIGVKISLKLITAKSWSGAPKRDAAKFTAVTPGITFTSILSYLPKIWKSTFAIPNTPGSPLETRATFWPSRLFWIANSARFISWPIPLRIISFPSTKSSIYL